MCKYNNLLNSIITLKYVFNVNIIKILVYENFTFKIYLK